jgi:hypothetical protein
LFTVSPTLLNRRITPAPLRADVLVALGRSISTQNHMTIYFTTMTSVAYFLTINIT